MNIDKFTLKAWEVLENSQIIALNMKHWEVSPLHLLKWIIDSEQSLIKSILDKSSIDIVSLILSLNKKLNSYPTVHWLTQISVSPTLSKVIWKSEEVSKKMWDQYITLEHMLLWLANESEEVKQLFDAYSVWPKNIEKAVNDLRKWEKIVDNNPEWNFMSLEKYTIDLTKNAESWKSDPIIWRDDEVRRAIQILSRRTKNNPVLIGDAWVWKTAIAEALSQRIVNKDVPESLYGKKLLSLDMWALIAWAKYRWEFEERLKSVLKEVYQAQWSIILFIDEIHTIVWAWKSEWAMDAWNIIKPALARWELHCIWATTINEYRLNIEKDPALERRFQPIMVNEPSEEDCISILRWIKEKYELHHWITISDSAIIQAVRLSIKYLPDRRLPDKAIDLMDEAASSIRMELESRPKQIDDLARIILRLEIERESIKKEQKDSKRFQELEKDLASKKEEIKSLEVKWSEERSQVDKQKDLKTQIDVLNQKAEIYKREWNFEKLAEIQYSLLPNLEKNLSDLQKISKTESKFISEIVWEDEIAQVVSQWTSIPVSRLKTTETEKLLNLEQYLSKRIIWQDEAIMAVSNSIRRSRAWLWDESKPIWSFLFLWPTWVWKTELSKVLAQFLFDSEKALTRFDMSEYMEKHAVSKLIWSPPWYIWYEQWWRLTELVRRKPYSVILFDEVEKAHWDVFNLLLQILDDWILTDSKWVTVNFKNTIIIMTSNIWSNDILTNLEKWIKPSYEHIESKLHEFFRPEFINRLDEIVIFHPLNLTNITDILSIEIENLKIILKTKWFEFIIDKKALSYLAENGFSKTFWARPLKRLIKSEIIDWLSSLILKWSLSKNIKAVLENDIIKLLN